MLMCTAASCATNSPASLTSERGLIELSLTSSMSRSSSKSALYFDCQWLIRPSTDHTSVILQFLSLRLFAAGASLSTSSATNSSCSENFVEVHVGKNLVNCFVLLVSLSGGSTLGAGGTGPQILPTPKNLFQFFGSVIISLSRYCLSNDEGPAPPPNIFSTG